MENQWIYSEYLQTAVAYILHLQSLTFLLLSGAAFIFYKYKFSTTTKNYGIYIVKAPEFSPFGISLADDLETLLTRKTLKYGEYSCGFSQS
jgi:hypothetical protein